MLPWCPFRRCFSSEHRRLQAAEAQLPCARDQVAEQCGKRQEHTTELVGNCESRRGSEHEGEAKEGGWERGEAEEQRCRRTWRDSATRETEPQLPCGSLHVWLLGCFSNPAQVTPLLAEVLKTASSSCHKYKFFCDAFTAQCLLPLLLNPACFRSSLNHLCFLLTFLLLFFLQCVCITEVPKGN